MTYQYLMIRDANADPATCHYTAVVPQTAGRHQADHWIAIVLREPIGLLQLDQVASHASAPSRLVAGVYVETSDYAYIVGASGGEITFRVVLNDLIAQDAREGGWALEQCAALAGSPIWRIDAARRVVEWAARIPKVIDAEDVLALFNKHWVLATEAAAEFTVSIGIPDIDPDWLP